MCLITWHGSHITSNAFSKETYNASYDEITQSDIILISVPVINVEFIFMLL